MNILEHSLAKCPKCQELGAFITVHFSESTDCTRDKIFRTILVHEECGMHLLVEKRLTNRELIYNTFWDKKNAINPDGLTPQED